MRSTIATMLLLTALTASCRSADVPAAQGRSASRDTIAVADSLRAALAARAAAIFTKDCAGACHAGAHPKARLSLEPSRMAAMADAPSRQVDTLKLVDSKRPGRSYLLMKVRGEKGIKGSRMPDGRPPLAPVDEQALAAWAASLGAPAPAPAAPKKP